MPKPMPFLTALFAITLLNVSIVGCAQKSFAQKGYANDDCRSCHAPNGVAKDFSAIYTSPKSHHPVGIKYPFESTTSPNFKLPNGHSADITFFDRNGNGQPDSEDVQMFGANGVAIITCASCHKEHGTTPLSANATDDYYLRVKNISSALCTTCHNQ